MNRLHGLDALRGVAALMVALHHFARMYEYHPFIASALAVDLFFILSGFVMARTYEARMRDGLTVRRFLALRYKRLFLPLAIGSTIGFMWLMARSNVPAAELTAAYALILAFLPAFWMADAFLLNIPAWSLFLEISANALHGAVLGRMSNLLGLWVLCVILATITMMTGFGQWEPDVGSILTLIPRELACYLSGIMMFRRYGDKPMGNYPKTAVALFVVLLVATSPSAELQFLVALFIAPMIVRASLAMKPAAWATWIGALSYPLYATHVPVMEVLRAGDSPLAVFVGSLAVAATVSVLFEMRRRPPLKRALA